MPEKRFCGRVTPCATSSRCTCFLSQPIGIFGFIGLHIIYNLFIPISINNVGYDAVNHIVEEWLAQEAIVMGNDIFHIEHTHDVGHEIGCFCQWCRQLFALNRNGQLRIVVLRRDKYSIEHPWLYILQVVTRKNEGRMWKYLSVGKCERHFDYLTLMNLCYSHFSNPFVILPLRFLAKEA